MNHTELQEKLWAFYDGELSGEDRTALAAHTDICSDCRDQLSDWKRTRDQILRPLRTAASEPFVHSVMRRIRALDAAPARLPFFVRWALPALAFSAAGFAASLLYVLQPSGASPESLLWADHSTNLSAQWLADHPDEDQILTSAVTPQ